MHFDYNKDLIDIIKSCDGRNYNKKDKTWEVPISYLSYLLDMFVLIDDIQI
uniref:HepA-related protein (HARP) n=1 Tax=Siphoviridae sp. ctrpg19 TaxID=2826481 RepID=A0A8S5MK74_9CAUD|nr:MAG TPA: HepA-related protein (HARP) [Siphoviridae sp. ctrpg19]